MSANTIIALVILGLWVGGTILSLIADRNRSEGHDSYYSKRQIRRFQKEDRDGR